MLWQGISSIIYSKKNKNSTSPSSLIVDGKNIIHPQDIAEHFNNFFTSVTKEIQDITPPTKIRNLNNFILSPATPEEISDVI